MPDPNTLADPPASPPPADPPPAPAPSDPPPPSDPQPAADPPPPAPKSRAEERIEELVAANKQDRAAAAELVEYWRTQALRNGAAPPADPDSVKPDVAPKLADFNSTQAWADAHTAWAERQINKRTAVAVDTTLQTRERAAHEATARTTYQDRLREYKKTHPGSVSKIRNPEMGAALRAQPAIAEVVMASEHGPALAVHLSDNPAELRRIAQLPPTQAAHALGRIEAAISAAPPPKPPSRPSNAPAPPTPIATGGNPSINLETCSLDEYVEHRLSSRAGRKR